MYQYLESNNIISTTELNFEKTNLTQRWRRVKEYFHYIQDDYSQNKQKKNKDSFIARF